MYVPLSTEIAFKVSIYTRPDAKRNFIRIWLILTWDLNEDLISICTSIMKRFKQWIFWSICSRKSFNIIVFLFSRNNEHSFKAAPWLWQRTHRTKTAFQAPGKERKWGYVRLNHSFLFIFPQIREIRNRQNSLRAILLNEPQQSQLEFFGSS